MPKMAETRTSVDVPKKKNGRGRPPSTAGRGRGSRSNDQSRLQTSSPTLALSNGHLEESYQKVDLGLSGMNSYNCFLSICWAPQALGYFPFLHFIDYPCFLCSQISQDSRSKEQLRKDDQPSLEVYQV